MPNIRARAFRQNATDAERIFWAALRDFKRSGMHFRRQAPIGRYIVDFGCHQFKIVVEIDGRNMATSTPSHMTKSGPRFSKVAAIESLDCGKAK
jgi:very-short-patch-repair endonuclease